MQSGRFLLIVGLCLGLFGEWAEAGFPRIKVETPISSEQAQSDFAAAIEVAGLGGTRPVLEVTDDSPYAVASVAGLTPRVVVSRSFLNQVTRAALKFAFAHELAHLHLNHHEQIMQIRLQRDTQLAAAPRSSSHGPSKSALSPYHALEYSADALAMQWCLALGCTVNDASVALSHAYGAQTRETATHPAFESRVNALRFHHEIP